LLIDYIAFFQGCWFNPVMTFSKIKLVYIEDDQDLAEILTGYFAAKGMKVVHFASYQDFVATWKVGTLTVFLIDWKLQDGDGLSLAKKIREKDKVSALFMLSGKQEKQDVLRALVEGIDDYIFKPFDLEELSVRVLNAKSKLECLANLTAKNKLDFIPEAHAININGITVSLTSREYAIVEYMLKKLGHTISREELITQFSQEEKMTTRNVDVHVFSLRRKIKPTGFNIETVWGKGYRISERMDKMLAPSLI
jgi:DNA-binding response OmpR family regulator